MSILKNRNFAILFSGQLVSTVGNNLYSIALPWYVLMLTGSKSALAATGFVQSLPVFIGLFAGVFVDRWNKKKTMIYSDLLRALISLSLFTLAFFAHTSFIVVVALVLLLQSVGTVFSPASASLLPQILSKEEITAASGLQQSGSAVASLGGMLGGGFLLSLVGAPLLFLGNAISFLASVFSLFYVRANEPAVSKPERHSLFREWREGLEIMWRSKFVLRIVISAALVNFAGAPMDIVLTAWTKYVLHGGASMFGTFGAAQLIGAIVGGIVLGPISKRFELKTILIVGLLLIGISIAALGTFPHFYWDLPWVFVSGLSEGVLNGALGATIIQAIPRQVLGRVIGTLQSSCMIAQPLGMAVVGYMMVRLRLPIVFLFVAACSIISGLSFFIPGSKDDVANLAAEG